MRSAEQRHESMMEKTGHEHKKDENEIEKEKKKRGFDKELVLKKMEKFLESVQSENVENKETEASPDFRRNNRSEENLSLSDRSDTEQSNISSRGLSSKRREKCRRERTRTRTRTRIRSRSISRSISRSTSRSRSAVLERRHNKLREKSDDSSRIHQRRRVKRKMCEERKENKNEKDKFKQNYDRMERYEENDQHERYEQRKKYERMHRKKFLQNSQKKQESDRRDQRIDERKTSSCSSDHFENDKYRYKERKRYGGDYSPRDRKKELRRADDESESKYRNSSKYVYNKYTGEKIETKFFHVPLGFHTTKANWETYTKWLKRKNKYRFDIPFDQYAIYRRSSSLSPNTWEEFVNDSEESETEEETLEKNATRKSRHKEEKKKGRERDKEDGDTKRKDKHKKERKKRKRRDKEAEHTTRKEKLEKERSQKKRENSEEDNTSSSSESYDSLNSTTETEKKKKKENIKKRKNKKHDHKKRVSKEKREKGRKKSKRSDSRKRKAIKKKHKRKKEVEHKISPDLDKESISSSITSVSFLNEEMELEDEVLVKGKSSKENKTKDSKKLTTDIKDTNKENVCIEREEKEEHFFKLKEMDLVTEANKTSQREPKKNDLKAEEEEEQQEHMSDNESDIGPTPLDINVKLANKQINYGVAMMPGEGEAIAQFVQKGKRIPRRGEVGLSAEAIENYEKLGYVMSGSRHKRMNAIRMRKENQVYSVEEQRALAMYNYEERAMRENALINDLKEILRKQNEAIMNETQNESD